MLCKLKIVLLLSIFTAGVQIEFSEPAYTVLEDDPAPVEVCVVLLGELGISVTVDLEFTEDTATLADFSNTDMSLLFSNTSTNSQCFELNITVDDLLENDEVFNIALSSLDDVVEIVTRNIEVIVQDTSQLVVGFETPTGSVVEGGMFSACVRIVNGQLSDEFVLPLRVQSLVGQGKY